MTLPTAAVSCSAQQVPPHPVGSRQLYCGQHINKLFSTTTFTAFLQMNLADSERMAGVLESVGYECSEDPAKADVLIYNTCSIREKAEVKVYSALGKQVCLETH